MDEEMADSTFGVKVPEELKEQLQKLMSDSKLTGKDFMQQLINVYQVEKTKESMPLVAEDLKELQSLTQRINNIYLNLGYRIDNVIKIKDTETLEQLQLKDNVIMDLQSKNETVKEEFEKTDNKFTELVNLNNDLNKYINQLTESNNNLKELNEEYKSKIDTLTGIVTEYKQYKEEIKECKKELEDIQFKSINLDKELKDKDSLVEKLNLEIKTIQEQGEKASQELEIKYNGRIEELKEQGEFQTQKSILALQLQHQKELEEVNTKSNKNIEEYQTKYKYLLEELEQIRKSNTPIISTPKKMKSRLRGLLITT